MSDGGLLPLRIEWDVLTPWCPPAMGLHLDGVIAWAAVRSAELEGRPFASFDEIHDDLPFERFNTDSGWVWKASMIRPITVRGSERLYMTAKTDSLGLAEHMIGGRIEGRPLSTIDTVRGPFKNDAFWFTLEHIDRCVAYCVADPDRLVALLELVTHLGKRTRFDYGRVDSPRIEEDGEALQRWSDRQLPEPREGYVPVQGRLRPPYWQGEGATTVWRPL